MSAAPTATGRPSITWYSCSGPPADVVPTYQRLPGPSTRTARPQPATASTSLAWTVTVPAPAMDLLTVPVTFLGTAKDPWGNVRAGFEAEITINRKDFGLAWNATLETGGFLVGDDVKISVSIQATQAKD